jgi:hypothetical protein
MNTADSETAKTDARPFSGVLPPLPYRRAAPAPRSVRVRSALNVYDEVDNLDLQNERALRRAVKSNSPLRLLIAKRSESDYVHEAQRFLAELGYDPGPIDGRLGPSTAAAIKEFQKAQGLNVNGQIALELYAKLREVTGRAPPSHGVLRVRQNGKEIYSSEVSLSHQHLPIGTHLYTLIKLDSSEGTAVWTGLTIKSHRHVPDRSRTPRPALGSDTSAMSHALDRLQIPAHARLLVEDMLTLGSSLIITDGSHNRETGVDTDFIVLANE